MVAVLCAASAIVAVTTSASALERIYTDVESCRTQEGEIDEFKLHCMGPDRVVGVLNYFDGRALPIFGEDGGGWFGDGISGTPYNNGDDPLMVGSEPTVYGPKIEWTLADGGRPCAATVRIQTDQGSRLVVTSLGGGGRVGVVPTNEEAQKVADKACGEFGPAPAARPFVKVEYERKPGDDPLLKQVWGEDYKTADMPGEADTIYGFVGERRLEDGRLVQITAFPDMMRCSANKCPTTVLIDGKVAAYELLCTGKFVEVLASGETLRACGQEISLKNG